MRIFYADFLSKTHYTISHAENLCGLFPLENSCTNSLVRFFLYGLSHKNPPMRRIYADFSVRTHAENLCEEAMRAFLCGHPMRTSVRRLRLGGFPVRTFYADFLCGLANFLYELFSSCGLLFYTDFLCGLPMLTCELSIRTIFLMRTSFLYGFSMRITYTDLRTFYANDFPYTNFFPIRISRADSLYGHPDLLCGLIFPCGLLIRRIFSCGLLSRDFFYADSHADFNRKNHAESQRGEPTRRANAENQCGLSMRRFYADFIYGLFSPCGLLIRRLFSCGLLVRILFPCGLLCGYAEIPCELFSLCGLLIRRFFPCGDFP